jgi:hypothetical protein
VRGGETFEFEIELRFHPQGCNDSGTMTVANWPTVGIGVLGRSYERVSDMDFAFERTGPTPGCRLHTD